MIQETPTHDRARSPMHQSELRRCRRFGWSLLALTAISGLALELAHGYKLASYMNDELTRLLLVLAHAHAGIGALIVLAFGHDGPPSFHAITAPTIGRLLRSGIVLLTLGFGLSAINHPEGDPNALIFLAPIGGFFVSAALIALALASFGVARRIDLADGEDSIDR